MPKTTAKAVANFFIGKAMEEKSSIDHLKLQKLVYYAYAWWLGNNPTEELFSEDIEAWPHGPVVKELYLAFKDSGRDPITYPAMAFDFKNAKHTIPHIKDADLISALTKIWDAYKHYSGIQLSNMTHAPDDVWEIMRQNEDLSLRPRIPAELIGQLYKEKVEKLSGSHNSGS